MGKHHFLVFCPDLHGTDAQLVLNHPAGLVGFHVEGMAGLEDHLDHTVYLIFLDHFLCIFQPIVVGRHNRAWVEKTLAAKEFEIIDGVYEP